MSTTPSSTQTLALPKSRFKLRSPHAPPLYRIDLSLPPGIRYDEICRDFREELQDLVDVYREVLLLTPHPRFSAFLAKKILRKAHSKEETEELKGIAKATGVPLHLVVAYNTFLDLFSGCVGGGVRVQDAGKDSEGIVHFRGLDWEMELLRELLICIEYVRDGKVIARAVSYAGYIGVLTGVRQGLSISFNYRARLNSTSSVISHRMHQFRLLLGFRSSVASTLRSILLSPGEAPSLEEVKARIALVPSSPCYLTFCSPTSILIIEKDLHTVEMQTSDRFLVVTNHDLSMEGWSHDKWTAVMSKEQVLDIGGVRAILNDSIERKECVSSQWQSRDNKTFSTGDVKRWLRIWPVRNETTHFVCIMDPAMDGGSLSWVEAYKVPVMEPRIDSLSESVAS